MTFPEIYQRKFTGVNATSMMIDISVATVYSGGVLTNFVFFQFFFSFSLRLKKENNPLLFCACFD